MTLLVGDIFTSKNNLKQAIQDVFLNDKRSYITTQTTPKRYSVRCQEEGCTWKLTAYALNNGSPFMIHSVNLQHTCSGLRIYHESLTASKIVAITPVVTAIQHDLQTTTATIRTVVASNGATVNYQNAYRAQKKIKKDLYGSFEEAYDEIQAYFRELRACYNDPIIDLDVTDGRFCRVLICFRELIKCYNSCKKMIAVDGCHLYGKYKGVLLTAVCQDGLLY
ncbi:hypothetical protein GEMRC1_002276 [Eukaryota sp. GEM-RC1]